MYRQQTHPQNLGFTLCLERNEPKRPPKNNNRKMIIEKALFLPYKIIGKKPMYFICTKLTKENERLVPTGKCNKGELASLCALRELREELGVKGFANFFPLNLKQSFVIHKNHFKETAFAFEIREKVKLQKEELKDFKFLDKKKALNALSYNFHKHSIEKCHNIIEKKKYPKIFILVGPIASGKDTIIEKILQSDSSIKRIKTIMTRPYKSEDDKKSRIHVSPSQLDKLEATGDIIEKNKMFNYWFASSYSELLKVLSTGSNGIINLDINGAQYFKNNFSNTITIFINAPMTDLKKRMVARGRDDKLYIEERLEIAKKEVARASICDYTILNRDGEIKKSVDLVAKIIKDNK